MPVRFRLGPSKGEFKADLDADDDTVLSVRVRYSFEPGSSASHDDPGSDSSVEILAVLDDDGKPVTVSEEDLEALADLAAEDAVETQHGAYDAYIDGLIDDAKEARYERS
jgi:hypothetical protein